MKGDRMSKCDDCRWGIKNVGLDVPCPPCKNNDAFEPAGLFVKVREFIETEADALEDAGMSVDADRFREFLKSLDPCT